MKARRLTRLKDYNYSQSGYYFVTICTKNREQCFGKIEDEKMVLNNYGKIAKEFWSEIPLHFEHVKIDEFRIMPNHVHGILNIEDNGVGNAYMRSLRDRTKMLLSRIVQQYKSSVTRKINSIQNEFNFGWQNSFYDHVIRNERSLDNLRRYTQNNPLRWELDIENRKNVRMSHVKGYRDYYKDIVEGCR